MADGYGNRRVIVFDSKTGAYKRHWGAYGNAPNDDKQPPYSPTAELSKQFSNPVHCVRVSNDGLVYVCDRANNRIQVFRKDGTFVKEFQRRAGNARRTARCGTSCCRRTRTSASSSSPTAPTGRSFRSCATPAQLLNQWGRHGRQPGQFKWVHNMAIDSKGNLYTAEVGFGRRVQKFKRMN